MGMQKKPSSINLNKNKIVALTLISKLCSNASLDILLVAKTEIEFDLTITIQIKCLAVDIIFGCKYFIIQAHSKQAACKCQVL